jgi:hypothetical protein
MDRLLPHSSAADRERRPPRPWTDQTYCDLAGTTTGPRGPPSLHSDRQQASARLHSGSDRAGPIGRRRMRCPQSTLRPGRQEVAASATTAPRALARAGPPNRATVEALVAEIRITNNQAIPVFKIPGGPTATPGATRFAQWRVVGRTRHDANRAILIVGDPLPVRFGRSRD